MRVIAHRGFAAEAPENTIAAVRRAGELADVVEIDVRRCASGELVVVHDATVDRVTDGSGAVREMTLSELQALDVRGSDESIPRLETAVDAVPPDVSVNLELKETGLAADALAVVADAPNDVVLSSFVRTALREVRDADPTVPTAFITSRLRDRPVRTALELDCEYVHPNYRLCFYSRLVSRAHEAGLGVNVWTVNRAWLARLLARRGVDGVATDRSGVVPRT